MQQIAKFDHELNYLPFRYRHRSNTNPKNKQAYPRPLTYSRGKMEKHNPEKINWDHWMPAVSYLSLGMLSISPETQLSHEKERLKQEWQQEGGKMVADDGHLLNNQHQIEEQSNYGNEERQHAAIEEESQENISPIKLIQLENESDRIEINENTPSVKAQDENTALEGKTQLNSIFNESDVQEIKQIILQNIRQSESHDDLHQHSHQPRQQQQQQKQQHQNAQQQQEVINDIKQEQITSHNKDKQQLPHLPEKLSFEARYERLKAINLESQSDFEFNRAIRRRQMTKKIKKIKPHSFANINQFNNKSNYTTPLWQRQLQEHTQSKQLVMPPAGSEIKLNEDALSDEQILRQPLWPSQSSIQKQKEDMLYHNPSINTTNSSHAKHQHQDIIKCREVLTFDKYKQLIRPKETPIDKKYSAANMARGRDERYPLGYSSAKKIQTEPQQLVVFSPTEINPASDVDSPAIMLTQFTKEVPSNPIRQLKETRSQEKQKALSNQKASNYAAMPGYAGKQTSPLGYKTKQISNAQSYLINMKKKKEKAVIAPHKEQKQIYLSPIIQKNPLERIQEETCSLNEHESFLSFPAPNEQSNAHLLEMNHDSSHSIHNVKQQWANMNQPQKIDESCQLAHLDIQELQQGIAEYLNSSRRGEEASGVSNRAQSQEESHPTSRVLDRQIDQIKSEDGDELLKFMAGNSNFKELSSLVFEDRSPEHQDLSLISHQLCEIINSNQSEFSATPTPQNVSLSSSIHYNFEDSQQQASKEFNPDDSAYVQINEDSTVFQQRPLFPTSIFPTAFPYSQEPVGAINLEGIPRDSNQPSRGNPDSRRSTQAQADENSIRQYRSHFHPSHALRKFKHGKHNSADFQEKSLHSARINHSLSTLRRNIFSLESTERTKSRLEKNIPRFRTRLN